MKVRVTKKDIDHGKCDLTCCPVALALNRVTQKKWTVLPLVASCYGYKQKVVRLPRDVITFISNFDAGNKVSPFTFELEIPE